MLSDHRYSRQELVEGWNQERLADARVLVVGAGALGNEVLKNLALAGVGRIDVADCDVVEVSNLARCVLFCDGDLGVSKAEVAARRLHTLQPQVKSTGFAVNVEYGLGAGALRRYDVVVGAVDSIAARLALNRLCRHAGRPYLDGGMDAFSGQVAFFHPTVGACYECTMTESMWARVDRRMGCLGHGSDEPLPEPKLASTVTLAALVGAAVAQEVLRLLQGGTEPGMAALQPGTRALLSTAPYCAAVVRSTVRPDCQAHADSGLRRIAVAADPAGTTCQVLLRAAGADELHLQWDVVSALECFGCSRYETVRPLFRLQRQDLTCPACGGRLVPELRSTVTLTDPLACATLDALGVPPLAVLHVARRAGETTETFVVELQRATVPDGDDSNVEVRRQTGVTP